MGLLQNITNCVFGKKSKTEIKNQDKQSLLRKCYFEVMEQRRVLNAESVIAGVTYVEGDEGQDSTPDHFEVTFEGGSDATQMTHFTINGDQDRSGDLSDGDMFFDATDLAPGAGGYHTFEFDANNSQGLTAEDVSSFSVSADGLLLSVEVNNFDAGDVFAFTIDVDEVERFRVDKIASGVEFEASLFEASFADDHHTFEALDVAVEVTLEDGFIQQQFAGVFFDEYDTLFGAASVVANDNVGLHSDNELGNSDRTAGAIDAYSLVPKPVTISGMIYHDENLNCELDENEMGIAGVQVELQRLNEASGEYEVVGDTVTDSNGNYEFGESLSLMPGTFRIIEQQPEGYLDVAAEAGSQGGDVMANAEGDANLIADINIPLGGTAATDYDFKEVRPASISGHVWDDENNDGNFDSTETGIANVLVEVTRIGAKPNVVSDPFAGTDPILVRTDANGYYEVDSLPPGIYQVVEINQYPSGEIDPLAPYLDGKDSIGNIDGASVGFQVNDRFSQIELCADDHGVNYNFGEIRPAEIGGTVWHDANNDGLIGADEGRIGGVVIQLFDKQGNPIAETQTDPSGEYEFTNLVPGEYLIRETQPNTFTDGIDNLGQIDGMTTGVYDTNDEFCVKLEPGDKGVNYDFGELKSSSISGTVHADANGDCVFDLTEGDQPLEGVELVLLDQSGSVVGQTTTNINGEYSFDGLPPGTYSVREMTPDGYLDGGEMVGQIDGVSVGVLEDDLISGITLGSGQNAVDYDFCEHIPAEICGTVFHDRNDNGHQDSGEEGIAGVRMVLTDADGAVIAESFTDAEGAYCFADLIAGTYCIKEIQPDHFIDGKDTVGNVGGVPNGVGINDEVCNVTLTGGESGQEYNFGELKTGTISGVIHIDSNGNCVFEPGVGEAALADVTLELLDANGEVIATTLTDSHGSYQFSGILPGEYSIRETQPAGLFTGGEVVGDGGGVASENLIEGIVVFSGQNLTEYNFCENEAAEISGRVWEDGPAFETADGTLPDQYRAYRDSVYQPGVDTPISGVKMQLYYNLDPVNNSTVPRPVKLSEVQAEHYEHMGTADPNAPVWVETMANGEYRFRGLQAGNYIVLETQPDGYFDANDVPGTTTGFSYNSYSESNTAPESILSTFSNEQIMDAVIAIKVEAGGISELNNFSEVRVVSGPSTPPIVDPPPTPRPPGNPVTPFAGMTNYPGLAGSLPVSFTAFVGTGSGSGFQTEAQPMEAYSWHLSVVNAGLPRGVEDGVADESVWLQAGYLSNADWNRFDMDDAVWSFTETRDDEIVRTSNSLNYGVLGGVPLAGDFDGDGIDELAVFKDGFWMIDINRDGRWDQSDLLVKLGDGDDRPVVGDWDGDGKDDIGIYGPIWEHDREAIDREPGLPNPENSPYTQPKNVPPSGHEATSGARVMKLTSYGKQRADVVDHVFGVGESQEIPVTGDWNGNGIRSIGTFQDGTWHLDINGDGRFDSEDVTARFGQTGDVPVVGDFDGDGIEEIAVYRSGTWMIDTDGNRELNATDKTFEMGGALDQPVVGDWDGDGVDEPALYTTKYTEAD